MKKTNINLFPFLIGKVLTTPAPTKPGRDPEPFPFLIGKVLTIHWLSEIIRLAKVSIPYR